MFYQRLGNRMPVETPSRISLEHLRNLAKLQHLFPRKHTEYLWQMRAGGIEPRVIYDIGANVLHWLREARTVWPNATYFAFEAMQEVAPIYDDEGVDY